jgi:hypothetical protein
MLCGFRSRKLKLASLHYFSARPLEDAELLRQADELVQLDVRGT